MSELIFKWIGIVITAAFLIALVILLFDQFLVRLNDLFYRICRDTKEVAYRDLGQSIRQQAHWFSEEPRVNEVLLILGKHISDKGILFNVEQVRTEYREKTKGMAQ